MSIDLLRNSPPRQSPATVTAECIFKTIFSNNYFDQFEIFNFSDALNPHNVSEKSSWGRGREKKVRRNSRFSNLGDSLRSRG